MIVPTSPIRCVDVLAEHASMFVIIERLSAPLGLALPGGKIEPGESEEDAAVREMYEETGLVFTIRGRIGFYDAPGRDPRGVYVSTALYGDAVGIPRSEFGKTRVHRMLQTEIMMRSHEFVLDHFAMIRDHFGTFGR